MEPKVACDPIEDGIGELVTTAPPPGAEVRDRLSRITSWRASPSWPVLPHGPYYLGACTGACTAAQARCNPGALAAGVTSWI
jgi:hypothetical protein